MSMLVTALRSGEVPQRCRAARRLGSVRGQEALSALIEALGDENAIVRWTASEALARRGDRESLTRLLAETRAEEPRRRAAALDALALHSVTEADFAAAVSGCLDRGAPVELRLAALRALERRPVPRLLAGLLGLARDASEDDIVRHAAMMALSPPPPEIAEGVRATLSEALRHSNALLRAGGAKAMGRLGCADLAALAGAARDGDAQVRWEAARAMGRVGNGSTLPLLKGMLRDRTRVLGTRISTVALWAMVQVSSREAVRRLSLLLRNSRARMLRRPSADRSVAQERDDGRLG